MGFWKRVVSKVTGAVLAVAAVAATALVSLSAPMARAAPLCDVPAGTVVNGWTAVARDGPRAPSFCVENSFSPLGLGVSVAQHGLSGWWEKGFAVTPSSSHTVDIDFDIGYPNTVNEAPAGVTPQTTVMVRACMYDASWAPVSYSCSGTPTVPACQYMPVYAWQATSPKYKAVLGFAVPACAANVKVILGAKDVPNAMVTFAAASFLAGDLTPVTYTNIAAVRLFPPNMGSTPSARATSTAALVDSAATAVSNVRLIVLPEASSGPGAGEDVKVFAETVPGGPMSTMYAQKAIEHNLWISAGIMRTDAAGKIFNSVATFAPNGSVVAIYDKRILTVDDEEANLVTASSEQGAHIVDTGDVEMGKMCVIICWEVQFQHLIAQCDAAGANLLLVPAWNTDSNLYGKGVVSSTSMGAVFAIVDGAGITGIQSPLVFFGGTDPPYTGPTIDNSVSSGVATGWVATRSYQGRMLRIVQEQTRLALVPSN